MTKAAAAVAILLHGEHWVVDSSSANHTPSQSDRAQATAGQQPIHSSPQKKFTSKADTRSFAWGGGRGVKTGTLVGVAGVVHVLEGGCPERQPSEGVCDARAPVV